MGNNRYSTFPCCDGLRGECAMGFCYGHHSADSGSSSCEL